MIFKRILIPFALFIINTQVQSQIICESRISDMDHYAAKELQGYIYQLWGTWLTIYPNVESCSQPVFIMGLTDSKVIKKLKRQHYIDFTPVNPGSQGYLLKTISYNNKACMVIAANDSAGLLYGVYGLLSEHFKVAFSFSGDVFPDPPFIKKLPIINEIKTPSEKIRGFLPWTNFPQSATVYSWKDWKFILDQAAKMRLNFVLVHNYNGEQGHNEMFHNFTLNGKISRVWMPTVHTGHGWGGPAWDVEKYLFQAEDFFDDYDFGSECALHNEYLSNEDVTAQGVSLFQQVIRYAHSRGIKIGLGIDIDLIPPEYHAQPEDTAVVNARVHQLSSDYPALDYLFCFQSENVGKNPVFYKKWKGIFDGFYKGMKEKVPETRIAVSGWGLHPSSVRALPKDVICAPISYYSAGFENGADYGEREYWGCPWLERDIASSQYYYPYNIDLSETIACYQRKASNMKGLFCLTWRLTDAISPKLDYISKVSWDNDKRLSSSEAVYKAYAALYYGEEAAADITAIINQNEPYCSDFAECQKTPPFMNTDSTASLMNISYFGFKCGTSVAIDDSFKIMAKNFNASFGTKLSKNGENGDSCVAGINAGNWLRYDSISFDGCSDMIEVSLSSANINGGVLICKIDALNGETIGTLNVNSTSSWKTWIKKEMRITPIKGIHSLYFIFEPYRDGLIELKKAKQQLKVIDHWLKATHSKMKHYQLNLLRERIAAVKNHIELNDNFSKYSWADLPGALPSWCAHFINRVVDISSLGNITSIQNRFIQLNYVAKIKALRASQQVKSPSNIMAKGTSNGAIISWSGEDSLTRRFLVYRNNIMIGQVDGQINRFIDVYSGVCSYTVIAENDNSIQSPPGIPYKCYSGTADNSAPLIAMISPPLSGLVGQGLSFKVSLIDNRTQEALSVRLLYRKPGEKIWKTWQFDHKVNATFNIDLPETLFGEKGLEYYLEATDGKNVSHYPVSAPETNLMIVTYGNDAEWTDLVHRSDPVSMTESIPVFVTGQTMHWQNDRQNDRQKNVHPNIFQYRIYRSKKSNFKPGQKYFVTYVAQKTHSYRDYPVDFDGSPLKGDWYYKIVAVDIEGKKVDGSKSVMIHYDH